MDRENLFQKEWILPSRILRAEGCDGSENLLAQRTDQSAFASVGCCTMRPGGFVLLDFGKELNGGARLIFGACGGKKNVRVRLRFGESAMECMAELGEKNSTNDHSVRDQELLAPWVGMLEYGNTGFRFLRIDNLENVPFELVQAFAAFTCYRRPFEGSFLCGDDRLNRIWDVGAYTLRLNMQHYIYDGIKRDRAVWIGDMHPESLSVQKLFGWDGHVERSLDFIRDLTPPQQWMNGIPAYSLWWIKIHYDWFVQNGNAAYLREQVGYIRELVGRIVQFIQPDGRNTIEFKFIDWPSSENAPAQDAGIHALLVMALGAARKIFERFSMPADARLCAEYLRRLSLARPDANDNKQALALLVYAGVCDAETANRTLLSVDPLRGISTFLGCYLLQARGMAGDVQGALEVIRRYYGAMLDLGATTFWEDFNYDWLAGAQPIDRILQPGEYDVHGDNGAYCYKGFRHSLCHGWSTGPIPFLSEYVLGVRVREAGCKAVEIAPDLGGLEWAEGTYPTPYGNIFIRHELANGTVRSEIRAPEQVHILCKTAE